MNSTADLIGALPPPPGVTPNFVNPPTIGHRIIIVGIVFPVLTIPFLAARLYAKYFLMKKLHVDDYLIMLGVPFTVAFSILQMYQTKNGSGYHKWDITVTKFQKYFFIGGTIGPLLYGIGKLFVKSSILTLYLRLTSERRLKMVTYVVLFVVCGYSLFAAFAFLFMCRPMERYWDLSVPGKCLDTKTASVLIGVFNVATDLVMLLLPIWLLKPLRLPRKQKIGVTLILMTGSFVCIVSVITLTGISHVMHDPDYTWAAIKGLVWCTVEMYTAIICACLPSLKIIVKHYYPGFFEFEQNLHLSTMTAFPTDDVQFSGQQVPIPFDQSASKGRKPAAVFVYIP